jgi:hypothetical protein
MYLTAGEKFKRLKRKLHNYRKKMFNRRVKTIRIIGDPDNQPPDKWSSTIFSANGLRNSVKISAQSKTEIAKRFNSTSTCSKLPVVRRDLPDYAL